MEENPIYKFMRDNDLTQLDEKSFLDKYSDPNEATKIHKFMVDNDLTELPSTDFYNKYLSVKAPAKPAQQEQVQEFGKTSSWTDTPRNFLATINQTVYNIPSDIADAWTIASAFTERQLAKLGVPGADPNIGAEDIGLAGVKFKKISDEYRGMVENITPVDEEFKGTFVGGVAQGLGQVTGMMLTGGGSSATQIAKAASLSGTSLTPIINAGKELAKNMTSRQGLIGGSMNASANYRQAKQEGASEEDALQFGIENLVVGSIMENLPIQSMFSRIAKMEPNAKILDVVKQGLVGAGEEAVTEAMQTTYENMSAQRIYDVNRSMLDGVGESAAVGGTVGFILNAAMSALTGKRARVTSKEEQAALDQAIQETQDKINTVEGNNKNVQETVSTLEKTKFRTINDGSQDLQFIEMEDGSVEYTEEGMSQPTALAMTGVLNMRYPNFEFSLKDNTGKDPLSPSDFTITGRPRQVKTEQPVVQQATEQPAVEQPKPVISDMVGESVTVRIGNRNVSGIVEVDEGGKTTITEGNRIYEVPADTEFSEFTRPVSVSPEGDFVVNGDPFQEARIVVENGERKALLIREDGTTKAITNPRVVEEIEYNIALASVDQMTDEEADNLSKTYDEQRKIERPAEAGTDQTITESEEDRKLREATEEIDLIEQLALMELEDVESQAKLVEFTPKTMKTPSVYLVKKNADGSYTATLNGRKLTRPEIISELGKLFEQQTGAEISKLQEQTNRLRQEVEQKLFGRGQQPATEVQQPASTEPTGPEPVTPKTAQQKSVDQGIDNQIPVEKNELAKRIRANKIKGALSSIDFGISVGLYNSAIEFMAKQVERGTKFGDAIAATIKWIDGQVDSKWNKDGFSNYVERSLRVGPEARKRAALPKKVMDRLTEDEDGNIIFHHYSFAKRDVIKPTDGTGSNLVSKEEAGAISSVGGVAQYYTQEQQKEFGTGPVLHTVKVPKDRVYYLQGDPLNFYDEAKRRFNEVRPGQAFGPNEQAAWIGKIANENGFEMLVSEWRNTDLRAQTTLELSPSPDNVELKPKEGVKFNIGDTVDYSGTIGTVTDIDGDIISISTVSELSGNTIVNKVNLSRGARFVKKISGAKSAGGAKAIAAPFYNTQVKSVSDADALRNSDGYKSHLDAIRKIADLFGIKINQLEDTIGGYQNDSGEKIVELSTVITVADDTNLDRLEEMAAVLASMAPEVQESTIAGRYVTKDDPGYLGDGGIDEFVLEVGDLQGALDSLKAAEIFDFTLNETEGTVTLLDFSKGKDDAITLKLARFVQQLSNRGISYGKQERRAAESRFIDPGRRAEILGRLQKDASSGTEGQKEFYNVISEAIRRDNAFRKKKGYDEIKKPTKKEVKEAQVEAVRKLKQQSGIDLSDSEFLKKTQDIAKTTEFMVVPSDVIPGWVNTKSVKKEKQISFEGDITMETLKKESPDTYANTALRLNAHPVFSSLSPKPFIESLSAVPKSIQKMYLDRIKADIKSSRDKKKVKDPGPKATAKELEDYRIRVEFRRDVAELLKIQSLPELLSTMPDLDNPEIMDLYAVIEAKYISKRTVDINKDQAAKQRARIESGKGNKANAEEKLIEAYIRKKNEQESAAQIEEVYRKSMEVAKGNIRFIFDMVAEPMKNLSKLWYDGANITANNMAEEYGISLEQSAGMIASLSPQMPWMSNLHLAQSVMQVLQEGKAVFTQEIIDNYIKNSAKYPEQRNDIPRVKSLIGTNISDLSDYDAALLIRNYYDLYMNRYAPIRIPSGVIVGAESGFSSFNTYPFIQKAVSIFRDGSSENISAQLGGANKIRNFYNNISNPNDGVSITNDTHAMAVAYMLPLSSASSEVRFGPGEYAFFADAYRSVAEEVGMLPREVQSITWEGIRGLYTEAFKTGKNSKKPYEIMKRYNAGEITIDQARNEILQIKGIGDANKTEWSEHLGPWVKGKIEDKFTRRISVSEQTGDAGLTAGDQPVPGVLPGVGGGAVAVDGKQPSRVEQQKAKVKALAKDLKDQVNKPNMGIAVDFRAQAEADARFYSTLRNLVVEYARLKGLQFNEFIQEVERLFNSKMSKENRQYLSEIWKEVKSDIPKKNVMTENQGLSEKDKVKQGLEEILSARAKEFAQKLNREMAKAAEAVKAQKAKLQAEKDRVEAIRSEIRQFINDNRSDINSVGAKLSSTILKKVNDAKTELSMKKAIEYMEKVLTDQKFRNFLVEKDSLIEKIKSESDPKKQVKKESNVLKSKKKQTADGIFVLKKIYEAIGMTFQEADARRQQLEQELFSPSGMDQDEIFMKQAELYSLSFAGLDQYMDLSKLNEMLEEIRDIKKTDKLNALQDLIDRRKRIEEGVSDALISINPEGKTIKPRYLTKEADFRPPSKLRAFILSNNNWRTLMDKLSRFHKSDPHQSPLSKRMNKMAYDMSQSEAASKRTVLNDIQENFERIFKTNKKDKFYVAQENTVKKPFTYVDINGNNVEIEMSQNEAYKRWMELQDESLMPTFEKMGFGADYVASLDNFMTPEVKAWAEWQLKEFYPKFGKSINKVYRKVFGVDMQLAENYSPIFRERKDIKDSPDALIASQSVMNTVSNSSLKSRTANTVPIAYMDGDRVLVNYIQQMEFFKNYAEGLSEMSSIMKDPRVLETIEQIHGREYIDQIRVFIDDFYRTSDKYKPFEALLKKFRQNFTVASLALNPVTFIKQLTSIPAYMNFMPAEKWMADVSFWANPIKNAKFLYENSRYLQNRYEVGFDRDVVSAMMADHKRSITGGKSFADKMMILTKYGDGGAILIGGWPVYNHYYKEGKKSGMTEKQAVDYGIAKFEEATDLSQQATDVKDFNTFQRGSEFYKVMTMYKTSPIQYHTLAMEAIRNMRYGRGSVSQNMKQFLLFHTILPMVFQWASMGFRFPDEEEEYYDLIQAGVIGNINAVFIIGDMMVYLKQAVIEGKPFDYSTNIVIDGLYGESEKALKKLTKLLDDEADFKDVASAIHNMANVASTIVPQMAPYRQTARTVEGINDIIQAETQYPVKRALGWSDWALGENPMANRQKNVLLEAMYGKDYKKKIEPQKEVKIIL